MGIDLYNLVIAAKLTKGGGGGGDIDVDPLTVTENGVYSASSGHAYSPVVVSVPQSGITPAGTKDISSNGLYDVTNFSQASVSIPTGVFPTGTKNIVENGIYDVTNFASASVSVPSVSPSISALTVTENGTYSVPAGVDGYNPVTVSVSGGGGGDHDVEDAFVEGTISGVYENSRVTQIGRSAFNGKNLLTHVVLPNVISIDIGAFKYNSDNFVYASVPKCTSIGQEAFANCYHLSDIYAPSVTWLGMSAFQQCSNLSHFDFTNVSNISEKAFSGCGLLSATLNGGTVVGSAAFYSCRSLSYVRMSGYSPLRSSLFTYCASLMTLEILGTSVQNLTSKSVFTGTPMANSSYTGSFGSIYVPASLVDSYKSATNWSVYADRITSYVE